MLLGLEWALFFQSGIGNIYFADVVEQGGDFDLVHMSLGDIQFSSDSDRPLRQASAMHAGADVLEIVQLVKRSD